MTKQRDYALDALKVLATILIIFHHYQQAYSVYFERVNFFGGFFGFGHVVELFFIISGYVMFPYVEKIRLGGGGVI